ncbi:hypothetical protein CBI33_15595 [Rhodococcus erythropolis]|nr:hypothetical protein CBI33_15595 [Rhodococcus erythropolis]
MVVSNASGSFGTIASACILLRGFAPLGAGVVGFQVETFSQAWLANSGPVPPWHSVLLEVRSLWVISTDVLYPDEITEPFTVCTRAYITFRSPWVIPLIDV